MHNDHLVAYFNHDRYEIVEDNPEVGSYLIRYPKDGTVSSHDYLQDSIEIGKQFANEQFAVPIGNWKPFRDVTRSNQE